MHAHADDVLFPDAESPLAVLVSGGLDSAILVGEASRRPAPLFPLYVRQGLYWEEAELAHLHHFLDALQAPNIKGLQVLELPVRDLYGEHWSVNGRGVPAAGTPDEAVFLPGRNVLLLAKALLWCHLHEVPVVALGSLGSNPFPDATPAFFEAFSALISQAVQGRVQVWRPYQSLHKVAVLRRGRDMPLEWTFSCIRPVSGRHCGRCNKCDERRQGFRDAGLPDPTDYRQEAPCTA